MIKNKKLSMSLIIFSVVLFLIWTILEIIAIPVMQMHISSMSVNIIKEILLKIIVWFIPSFILIKHFNEFMYIKREDIFSFKSENLKFISVILIFTAFHLISDYAQNGTISISESFSVIDIAIAFTVGLSEEMVFRGWLLNSALDKNNDKNNQLQIIFNAVLFLVIHFPVWIRNNLFIDYIISGSFIQIMLLSIIFSWSFIKSKNIIVPVVLHMYWDFLCFLL